MFCGVGARNGQESEGNGFMGFLYCSGAREERAAGSAQGCPRWRPPGRLWKLRGAWHGRGGSSARQQEGEEERRDAWGPARRKKAAGKPLHGAGVGAVGGRR